MSQIIVIATTDLGTASAAFTVNSGNTATDVYNAVYDSNYP